MKISMTFLCFCLVKTIECQHFAVNLEPNNEHFQASNSVQPQLLPDGNIQALVNQGERILNQYSNGNAVSNNQLSTSSNHAEVKMDNLIKSKPKFDIASKKHFRPLFKQNLLFPAAYRDRSYDAGNSRSINTASRPVELGPSLENQPTQVFSPFGENNKNNQQDFDRGNEETLDREENQNFAFRNYDHNRALMEDNEKYEPSTNDKNDDDDAFFKNEMRDSHISGSLHFTKFSPFKQKVTQINGHTEEETGNHEVDFSPHNEPIRESAEQTQDSLEFNRHVSRESNYLNLNTLRHHYSDRFQHSRNRPLFRFSSSPDSNFHRSANRLLENTNKHSRNMDETQHKRLNMQIYERPVHVQSTANDILLEKSDKNYEYSQKPIETLSNDDDFIKKMLSGGKFLPPNTETAYDSAGYAETNDM